MAAHGDHPRPYLPDASAVAGSLPSHWTESPGLFVKHLIQDAEETGSHVVYSASHFTPHSMSNVSPTLGVARKRPKEVSCALDKREPPLIPVCSWRQLARNFCSYSVYRRSNLSILKEINPEYSLEGLKLNLT